MLVIICLQYTNIAVSNPNSSSDNSIAVKPTIIQVEPKNSISTATNNQTTFPKLKDEDVLLDSIYTLLPENPPNSGSSHSFVRSYSSSNAHYLQNTLKRRNTIDIGNNGTMLIGNNILDSTFNVIYNLQAIGLSTNLGPREISHLGNQFAILDTGIIDIINITESGLLLSKQFQNIEYSSINNLVWSYDDAYIAVSYNFKIWVIDVENGNANLLTMDNPVIDIAWSDEYNSLAITTDQFTDIIYTYVPNSDVFGTYKAPIQSSWINVQWVKGVPILASLSGNLAIGDKLLNLTLPESILGIEDTFTILEAHPKFPYFYSTTYYLANISKWNFTRTIIQMWDMKTFKPIVTFANESTIFSPVAIDSVGHFMAYMDEDYYTQFSGAYLFESRLLFQWNNDKYFSPMESLDFNYFDALPLFSIDGESLLPPSYNVFNDSGIYYLKTTIDYIQNFEINGIFDVLDIVVKLEETYEIAIISKPFIIPEARFSVIGQGGVAQKIQMDLCFKQNKQDFPTDTSIGIQLNRSNSQASDVIVYDNILFLWADHSQDGLPADVCDRYIDENINDGSTYTYDLAFYNKFGFGESQEVIIDTSIDSKIIDPNVSLQTWIFLPSSQEHTTCNPKYAPSSSNKLISYIINDEYPNKPDIFTGCIIFDFKLERSLSVDFYKDYFPTPINGTIDGTFGKYELYDISHDTNPSYITHGKTWDYDYRFIGRFNSSDKLSNALQYKEESQYYYVYENLSITVNLDNGQYNQAETTVLLKWLGMQENDKNHSSFLDFQFSVLILGLIPILRKQKSMVQ